MSLAFACFERAAVESDSAMTRLTVKTSDGVGSYGSWGCLPRPWITRLWHARSHFSWKMG